MQIRILLGNIASWAGLPFLSTTSIPLILSHQAELLGRTLLFKAADKPLEHACRGYLTLISGAYMDFYIPVCSSGYTITGLIDIP